jgi:hypothetical protein
VLLQHGFFKRGTEQKLVCAKDSGEIALVPNLYGIESFLCLRKKIDVTDFGPSKLPIRAKPPIRLDTEMKSQTP